MQLAEVSTEFGVHCQRYRNHPKYQMYVNLIGARVRIIPDSEFIATGNGGGELWVKVVCENAKRGQSLSIPRRYLRLLNLNREVKVRT